MDQANGGRVNPSPVRSGHDHLLDQLADVGTEGAIEGDVLTYTGDAWVPGPPVPVGTIIAAGVHSDRTDLMPGYIPCDGRRVRRDQYADLFAALSDGATYGVGDGVTTFNVPDIANVVGSTDTVIGTWATWWIRF